MYGPGQTASCVAEYQRLNPVEYVVWRNYDGFPSEIGRYTNDYIGAVEWANLNARTNSASYFAKAWIEVDGVTIYQQEMPPHFTSYQGD